MFCWRFIFANRSCPSKVTLPAVGLFSRTTVRPVVDLPQPLSPTRPNVSFSYTSNVTPSTALTYAGLPSASRLPLMG